MPGRGGPLDRMIEAAVRQAVNAWNGNEELQYVFGRAGASPHPLLGGGDVGRLLSLMHRKRQVLHFVPPIQPDNMLAHAVIGANDYYNTKDRQFAPRQTILLNTGFFSDAIEHKVSFDNATKAERSKVSDTQMRALILLHEARHLYSGRGHGADPASRDGTWNDYILWTGFLGKKVARAA